ncbi:hypothetical protein B5P44_28475 [Mycobacterium sp. CBMA 213]|nr:hypothetical protein [Mycolicibacterium sp. CBMA 213]
MGDPVWLPDVLRAAGLRCDIYPGAMDRGHGDFGRIWGVVCHHTGSFGETPRGIAEHPELGLASQLYLSRDGVFTLCGVGIAWHAGAGSWPGIPTNNANQVTIGIEAANDGGGTPGKPHRTGWSDAQYNAYVTGVAAILNKLGQPADHAIGHKEWAGAAQGKWDPGAIDMNIFRADVAREQARLKGAASTDPIEELLMMELESTSPFATPGEPKIPAEVMLRNADAAGHRALVLDDAEDGDQDAIFRFVRAARGHDSRYTDAPSVAKWRRRLNRFIRRTAVDAASGDTTAVGILRHMQDKYPDVLQDFINTRKGN